MNIRSIAIRRLLGVYVAVALMAAAIFSRSPSSFVPLFLLLGYFILWLWPISPVFRLFADYFLLFVLAILYGPILGPWFSILPSLPVVALVSQDLREAAKSQDYQDTRHSIIPTRLGIALPLVALLAVTVSLLFGNVSILLASAVSLLYLGVMGVIVISRMPLNPVECQPVQCRIVAGSEDQIQLNITGKTRVGGVLFLFSSYEGLKISPGTLFLTAGKLDIKVRITPRLAGPVTVRVKGYATDRWGLIQVHFSFEPVLLYIIPRARYAEWLAKKYLEETKAGSVLLSSSILAAAPIYGLRGGIEYFGNRLYQPGDSLKNVDWKSSIKHRELISKEFVDFHGQSVVALVNLSVRDEEEADQLIYWIIITALTLARGNIPTVLAAYDHQKVRLVTPVLHARQLVIQSLEIAKEMVIYVDPLKYLNPPDISRLRADINRISLAKSEASRKLATLLQIEYENLSRGARKNPATLALLSAFSKGDSQSNILIISHRNHDAAALAVNTANYSRKGNAVMPLNVPGRKRRGKELAKV